MIDYSKPQPVTHQAWTAMGKGVLEAQGLLKMVAGLARRPTHLTATERDVLEDIVQKAYHVLMDASSLVYRDRYPDVAEGVATAVRHAPSG